MESVKRNMAYSIKLAEEFIEEMDGICNYISINLKAIDAANRLRKKVIDNILLLKKIT